MRAGKKKNTVAFLKGKGGIKERGGAKGLAGGRFWAVFEGAFEGKIKRVFFAFGKKEGAREKRGQ